ncbi:MULTISPECIES: hypothetical protein [Heyndrickxia]|uniref:hypothetical protein n=1 Tax=Heyndrickxia TaxID=2837504 RepID=UPI000AFCD257|nr:hypothetical protein [Heyndrickxia shackletonii]NEZ00665.1 hypothetical protein [Heyndrickxia shackletonii]
MDEGPGQKHANKFTCAIRKGDFNSLSFIDSLYIPFSLHHSKNEDWRKEHGPK